MDAGNLFIAAAVAGAVELLKRLHAKDYYAAAVIVVAAIIGGLSGAFHVQGLADAWTGVILGLSASGIITTASKVAKQS